MSENLVFEASKFMLLDMSMVLFFLLLMIIFLNIQSYIINKYFIPKNPKLSTVNNTDMKVINSDESSEKIDDEIVAVISAAVKRFREIK